MNGVDYNFDFLDEYINKAVASRKANIPVNNGEFFIDPDQEEERETVNYVESYDPEQDQELQEVRSATMEYLLGDDEEEVESETVDPTNVSGTNPSLDYMFPFNPSLAKEEKVEKKVPAKKGSIAETHNNPGNLKYASWMKKYGAVPGKKGLDGGNFALFPDVQSALKAREELLKKPIYSNKSVDAAMRLYSNNGYGGEIYPEISGKKMSELTPEQLVELTRRQVIREDRGYAKKLRFQAGGDIKFAETTEESYDGLNNPNYDEMVFPLEGMNTFRGLDSGEPVYLEDEEGNSDVLYGPDDTTEMEGEVYEQRMAAGGIPKRYKNMGFTKTGVKKKSTRPGKKWMVLAKKGGKYKVVHGGAKGMSDYTKHKNENRRDRFWDRMGGKNSSKASDPFSPLYWHKKFKTW